MSISFRRVRARQRTACVDVGERPWVGRYVLDGMAIADEFHGATPDGKPYLGIGEMRIREFYRVNERDRFTYTTDLSRDAGKTWDPPGFEITLTRVE